MRKVRVDDYVSIFAGMIPPFGVMGKRGQTRLRKEGLRFRSVLVLVGADLCVRPIALVMLPKVEVVHERPLQKLMILAFPRHSGESRNPERTGVEKDTGLAVCCG